MAQKGQFLAVAFTDINGNNKFDGKDTLIAGLIDTDKSKDASIGDTVTFGTYPHLSGKEAGTYLSNDSLVTSVSTNSESVVVDVADGQVGWFHTSIDTEVLFTALFVGGNESQFQDHFGTGGDSVFADSNVNGPGDPETGVALDVVPRSGDQDFLDVLIA